MSVRRGFWGTRFGFYLAAIGSAFGLGNLWRFPYVVAENGGGAFVLLYVFLVFIVGTPFLVGELMLGKVTRSSIIQATQKLARDKFALGQSLGFRRLALFSGYFSVAIAVVVLAYYAVISGWVLHFLMQFLVGTFSERSLNTEQALAHLLKNGWLQVGLTSVHFLVVMVVIAKDIEQGLERWVGYMMPVFGVLLVILAIRSSSMNTATDAFRFMLYPDFSKLNISSLGQALGHVFFTLSIGFGAMVTFGSYLRDNVYTPGAGFRVATVDSLISVFAGLMIFPLVLASPSPISGPELLFQTVPVLFSRVGGGYWFGVAFFLCLYLAALGASIGLLETIVSNLRETKKVKRSHAAMWAGVVCFALALVPALSSSMLKGIRWGDKGILELLDAILINWLLPIAALVVSQVVVRLMSEDVQKSEFIDDEFAPSAETFRHWRILLKYVATPIIVLALILQAIGLFSG